MSPPILRALAIAVLAKVRIDECYGLGQQLMEIAERDDDPILRVEGHYVLAMALQLGGEISAAGEELEAALSSYDRSRSAVHVGLYSQDPAVVCLIRHGVGLWLLGDAEASARRRAESLALAGELGHPFSLGYALTWDAVTHAFAGDVALARSQAEAAIELGREHRLPFWVSFASTVRGWAIAEQGDVAEGLEEIERGMAAFVAIGSRAFRPFQLGLHAEQLGRAGHTDRALEAVRQAIYLGETTHERWIEAMLHRVHGDLLALGPDSRGAETAYQRAIDVARRQGTRPLEARARARLEDLRDRSGRPAARAVRAAR